MNRRAYEVYMTDSIRAMIGANDRYMDWIDRKPQDTRTGDDIDRELSRKFGWEVKSNKSV